MVMHDRSAHDDIIHGHSDQIIIIIMIINEHYDIMRAHSDHS